MLNRDSLEAGGHPWVGLRYKRQTGTTPLTPSSHTHPQRVGRRMGGRGRNRSRDLSSLRSPPILPLIRIFLMLPEVPVQTCVGFPFFLKLCTQGWKKRWGRVGRDAKRSVVQRGVLAANHVLRLCRGSCGPPAEGRLGSSSGAVRPLAERRSEPELLV